MSDIQPEVLSDAEVLQIKKDKAKSHRKAELQRARRNAKRAAELALKDPSILANRYITQGLAPDAGGKYFKTLLLARLCEIQVGHTLSNAERIVLKLIEMAISGREAAIDIVMNRIDGKVLADASDASSRTAGLTILVGPNSQVLSLSPSQAPLMPQEVDVVNVTPVVPRESSESDTHADLS